MKLTEQNHWDNTWGCEFTKRELDLKNPVREITLERMKAIFERYKERINLLELGCANSPWLPYLYNNFLVNVTGVDYSEIGCLNARKNLEAFNAEGTIVCQDIFEYAMGKEDMYDVIISFGVIEHFFPPTDILRVIHKLLKHGGVTLNLIPNFKNILGKFQKVVDRDLFRRHVIMDVHDLEMYASKANFLIIECGYLSGLVGWGIINYSNLRNSLPKRVFKLVECVVNYSLYFSYIAQNLIGFKYVKSKELSPNILLIAEK